MTPRQNTLAEISSLVNYRKRKQTGLSEKEWEEGNKKYSQLEFAISKQEEDLQYLRDGLSTSSSAEEKTGFEESIRYCREDLSLLKAERDNVEGILFSSEELHELSQKREKFNAARERTYGFDGDSVGTLEEKVVKVAEEEKGLKTLEQELERIKENKTNHLGYTIKSAIGLCGMGLYLYGNIGVITSPTGNIDMKYPLTGLIGAIPFGLGIVFQIKYFINRKRQHQLEQKIQNLSLVALESGDEAPALPPSPSIIPAGDFRIEELPDRYRLHNIQYNNGLYIVDWSKELLDGGKNHSQEEWINVTKDSEWKISNAQLYHASLAALYHHQKPKDKTQKKLVETVKQMFKSDFDPSKLYLMTSTRVLYAANGKDEVTHDYGYSSARTDVVEMVGKDSYITASSGLEEQTEALLGNWDNAEIEQVYQWVSGKKPYLYRFNQKPSSNKERAVVLGCIVRFVIDCDYVVDGRPARGVVASARDSGLQ